MSLFPAVLHTMLITDGVGDPSRIGTIVRAVVAGGVRAVQLREPKLSAQQLVELCVGLRPILAHEGGVLIVNDRADVVAAGFADGVHLGHRSLTPESVRAFLPPGCLVGWSAHSADELRRGASADYAILAPLFPTASKPGASPLGLETARDLVSISSCPVVLLGGVVPTNVQSARETGAVGVAAMSAFCGARDPRAAAEALSGAGVRG